MTFVYNVYTLSVASEIELPGLPLVLDASRRDVPDISIVLGEVPSALESATSHTEFYTVGPGQVLLHVPNVGSYLATNGRVLTVAPMPRADEDELRLFLKGSAMAAILHQRGLLPLHASAVSRDGKCIALIGHSGAGKSTLAGMLVQRGWQLVTDDVLVFEIGATVLARSAAPVVKLWPQSVAMTCLPADTAPFASATYQKHLVSVTDEQFAQEAVPISGLYLLGWAEHGQSSTKIMPLPQFDALLALRAMIYREELIAALGHEANFLRLASALLSQARLYRFERRKDVTSAAAQVAALLTHIAQDHEPR